MKLRFYVKPVRVMGFDQWTTIAIDENNKIVWQTYSWSEVGATNQAIRKEQKTLTAPKGV